LPILGEKNWRFLETRCYIFSAYIHM
jgi:hypothetical protein